jgi:transcriptional regulator with XRE-family HTH domain
MDASTTATRLRRARLAAGLELADIERRTRISPSMLRWIDQGQFHRLPAGIYARAYVRAFAQAVGLDPAEVVASIEHALPPANEVVPDRGQTPGSDPGVRPRAHPAWRWMLAASADAVVLVAVCGVVVTATAAICGRPSAEIIALGLPGLAVLLAVVTALYFVIFAGVEGRTPGARACGLPPLDTPTPVHLDTVARRALRVFVAEASLGMEFAWRRNASRQLQAPYGSSSTP